MNRLNSVFIFFILILFIQLPSFSQTPAKKETIMIEELLEVMAIYQDLDEEFKIENKHIIIGDRALKKKNGLFEYISNKYPKLVNTDGYVDVKRRVVMVNCTVDENLFFNKFNFINGFVIRGCNLSSISFLNCIASGIEFIENVVDKSIEFIGNNMTGLNIYGNQINNNIIIEECSINDADLKIENNNVITGELIVFANRISDGSVIIGDNEVLAIIIEDCNIQLGAYGEFNNYQLPGKKSSDLYLLGNTFSGDSTTRIIFNKGNFLNLDIRDNVFNNNVYFVENNVDERFFLVNNHFDQYVSFEKFLFSEIWNELYWNQLSGHKIRFNDYGAKQEGDFEDEVKFKNLINIYKDMHTIFISRGDLESANACYSEMKELQGQMLKHIYIEDSSFGNLLRWQLNVLLRIYTNHGTDPGLAVVMSFYVILVFSLLYLFFPSEWDLESNSRLLISYENFLNHDGKSYIKPTMVLVGSFMLTITNSITLSINSFVTLGFGSIPTRGFSRYLCIIEGFIGWFLLSIFTVSLINQVLA